MSGIVWNKYPQLAPFQMFSEVLRDLKLAPAWSPRIAMPETGQLSLSKCGVQGEKGHYCNFLNFIRYKKNRHP